MLFFRGGGGGGGVMFFMRKQLEQIFSYVKRSKFFP